MADRIRNADLADLEPIKTIAVATGLFSSDDVGMFDEMHTAGVEGVNPDDVWLVLEDEQAEVAGAAYYAPEPFSDRLWNLNFLGVRPDRQSAGSTGPMTTRSSAGSRWATSELPSKRAGGRIAGSTGARAQHSDRSR